MHLSFENRDNHRGPAPRRLRDCPVAEAERFARMVGRKMFRLGVLPGNMSALAACRRAGFAEQSIEMVRLLD